ncbi:MAG: Tad domain-containing protein [Thermoguttaceae bacterium]|nr:Tad domain-containing protein [Thermoguttaceae bacterium]MDW8038260.1 Tad domain-containing protein [Thermoguttaceae bacterium]
MSRRQYFPAKPSQAQKSSPATPTQGVLRRVALRLGQRLGGLGRDQSGTISILAVFAALILTILLGMVMNVGREVNGKVQMQNAADSAAYSGGIILARGMNILAFTNHLLCDVFATTAFLREGYQRNAEKHVPKILAAWQKAGEALAGASFGDPSVRGLMTMQQKIPRLGRSILAKVPHEQNLVTAYSNWAATAAERLLPLFEQILQQEMIPNYQRAVVAVFPELAQQAALEVARRHSSSSRTILAVLWDPATGLPVSSSNSYQSVLPVVDTETIGGQYIQKARLQRQQRAQQYLNDLNGVALWVFDHPASLCRFNDLWRGYTCGHLMKLLNEEYPDRNLPFMIRTEEQEVLDTPSAQNALLNSDFTFIAVAYSRHLPSMAPQVFPQPIQGDALAFAQIRLFVPWRRLVYWELTEGGSTDPATPFDPPPGSTPGRTVGWTVRREHWRTLPPLPSAPNQPLPPLPDRQNAWDLFNQSWTVQLVPATHPNLAAILQTPPPVPELAGFQLPNLGGLSTQEIKQISFH